MKKNKNYNMLKQVHGIYNYIADNLYLNKPDLQFGGKRFNAALLWSLLTGLRQGKALIIGEPGLGKTTSAEYVCSLLYRIPLGVIWGSEVAGHPEQTEEKIIGRPDLGKLNQGEESVVWSHFALLPTKIVDEINRLPETKQSLILDGVDRGNWSYLNRTITNREYCLFATANYEDQGTNTIITPLIDRFDVMVESKHPGANRAYLIGMQSTEESVLRNEELETAFQLVLNDKEETKGQVKNLEVLCARFGEELARTCGIQTLSSSARQRIREQMDELTPNLDVNAMLRMVLSEFSFCYRYGHKRSHQGCDEGCHFTGYLCNAVQNCISNRLPISTISLSQALAWFMGDEEVGLEHLKATLPFTLAHRIQWKEKAIAQKERESRTDPLPIHLAKEAVRDIHRRYAEQGGRIKEALGVGFRIAKGENLEPVDGDHPLYWEIRRDLEEEDAES